MRTISILLAAATFVAAPAQAEVTDQSGNGFAVRHEVTVSVDPEDAYAMVRTPAKWWDKAHTWTGNSDNLYMDAQAGGCFCELIPNEATTESGAPQRTLRGSIQHMQILYVDPGKLMRLSGALGPLQGEAVTGTMTISLAPIKGGTKLTFEYVVGGYMRMRQEEAQAAVDGVIGAQASRLRMALGPLVGAGVKAAPVADDAPVADAEEDVSVGSLVADLEPDDSVSTDEDAAMPQAATGDEKSAAAVRPGTPTRAKPGTRPVNRRVRDKDEDETGR